MDIKNITVGEFQENCFVVWGSQKKAIVVDPGYDAPQILDFIKSNNLEVAAYLLTHGHMDHVSATADLYAEMPAPVGIHAEDAAWAFGETNQHLPFYPVPHKPAKIERFFEDGDEFNDGGLAYRVVTTPGHTPGGVCFHFYAEKKLFSGDTLFAGSVGRTDLHGGNSRILQESLKKLTALDDETVVYPGHGPATRLGYEKKTNFFLKGKF